MKMTSLLFASALLVAAPTLSAQEGSATVSNPAGEVKVSTGGDFVAANSGTQVGVGHRLMLGEGARATLTYASGCRVEYTRPGVYTVDGRCVAAVAKGTDWAGAGAIAAGAAVGAALLANMDKVPGPPVSR